MPQYGHTGKALPWQIWLKCIVDFNSVGASRIGRWQHWIYCYVASVFGVPTLTVCNKHVHVCSYMHSTAQWNIAQFELINSTSLPTVQSMLSLGFSLLYVVRHVFRCCWLWRWWWRQLPMGWCRSQINHTPRCALPRWLRWRIRNSKWLPLLPVMRERSTSLSVFINFV